MLIFLQSANFSLSPTRLLDQSCAGVESSEPCRTSSTHRRIVALPHPRWKGTTKRYAPLISRWCQPLLVISPGLHSGSQSAEIVQIERNMRTSWSKLVLLLGA